MIKEILTFGDIELKKKKKITVVRVLFFKKDVEVDEVLVSKKFSSGEKNYKYFILCLYNDYKLNHYI